MPYLPFIKSLSAIVVAYASGLKQQVLDKGLATSKDIVGGTHCLTRACIRASVVASLAKLRIATLDLLYLHNAAEVQLVPLGREAFMQVSLRSWTVYNSRLQGYGAVAHHLFLSPPQMTLQQQLVAAQYWAVAKAQRNATGSCCAQV